MASSERPNPYGTSFFCSSCQTSFSVSIDVYAYFFLGRLDGGLRCPHCNAATDWWKAVVGSIKDNNFPIVAFGPIGAQLTYVRTVLQPDTHTEVKLEEHGVPKNANILAVAYSPYEISEEGGWLRPIEDHGSTPLRHIIPRTLLLYPVPLDPVPLEQPPPRATKLTVVVAWITQSGEEETAQSLIDAFEYYSTGRHQAMVIPANIAVEAKLGRLLKEVFGMVIAPKRVQDFLTVGATYSHQLTVLLPFLAQRAAAPALEKDILGKLSYLRKLRNDLAHNGALAEPLTQHKAAELLAASLFGVHYLNFVRPYLLQPQPMTAVETEHP